MHLQQTKYVFVNCEQVVGKLFCQQLVMEMPLLEFITLKLLHCISGWCATAVTASGGVATRGDCPRIASKYGNKWRLLPNS